MCPADTSISEGDKNMAQGNTRHPERYPVGHTSCYPGFGEWKWGKPITETEAINLAHKHLPGNTTVGVVNSETIQMAVDELRAGHKPMWLNESGVVRAVYKHDFSWYVIELI
jgi:hypothetical protein